MNENLILKVTKKLTEFMILYKEEYILKPIISKEEIMFFESKFGVKLPKEYEWFITNITGGIVSKDYRQNSDMVKKIDFKNYSFEKQEFNPSIPFPFTTKSDFDELQEVGEPIECTNGNITICPGLSLIVNGKEYGNVWHTYHESDFVKPFVKRYDNDDNRYTFIPWLNQQLDYYISTYEK